MKLLSIIFTLLLLTACQPKEINSEVVEQPIKEVKDTVINESEKEQILMACTKDAKQCPNGRTVSRNPKNNCEFDSCDNPKAKKDPVMCSADVKECPDGTFVGRDHYNNCQFKDCPDSEQ